MQDEDGDGDLSYKQIAGLFADILKDSENGPLVIESWICPRCGTDNYEAHRWKEVVACMKCQHRVASKVPRYTQMLSMLPDLRDKGGGSDA